MQNQAQVVRPSASTGCGEEIKRVKNNMRPRACDLDVVTGSKYVIWEKKSLFIESKIPFYLFNPVWYVFTFSYVSLITSIIR